MRFSSYRDGVGGEECYPNTHTTEMRVVFAFGTPKRAELLHFLATSFGGGGLGNDVPNEDVTLFCFGMPKQIELSDPLLLVVVIVQSHTAYDDGG